MPFLIRRAFRYVARKAASDPRAREKASDYARLISGELRTIARDEDRARAAGRSVRRLLNRVQADRASERDRDEDTSA